MQVFSVNNIQVHSNWINQILMNNVLYHSICRSEVCYSFCGMPTHSSACCRRYMAKYCRYDVKHYPINQTSLFTDSITINPKQQFRRTLKRVYFTSRKIWIVTTVYEGSCNMKRPQPYSASFLKFVKQVAWSADKLTLLVLNASINMISIIYNCCNIYGSTEVG